MNVAMTVVEMNVAENDEILDGHMSGRSRSRGKWEAG